MTPCLHNAFNPSLFYKPIISRRSSTEFEFIYTNIFPVLLCGACSDEVQNPAVRKNNRDCLCEGQKNKLTNPCYSPEGRRGRRVALLRVELPDLEFDQAKRINGLAWPEAYQGNFNKEPHLAKRQRGGQVIPSFISSQNSTDLKSVARRVSRSDISQRSNWMTGVMRPEINHTDGLFERAVPEGRRRRFPGHKEHKLMQEAATPVLWGHLNLPLKDCSSHEGNTLQSWKKDFQGRQYTLNSFSICVYLHRQVSPSSKSQCQICGYKYGL